MSEYLVIIPALNEENTIYSVITSINKLCDVLVIDDGSNDETFKIASSTNCQIIQNDKNIGYDKSIEKGLKYSIQQGYEASIICDADGQHQDVHIKKVIDALSSGSELVVTDRIEKAKYAEYVAAYLGFITWGIKDPFSGLKAYRNELIKEMTICSFKSIGTELAIKMIKRGIKPTNLSIRIGQRESGKSRFGENNIYSNYKLLICFLRNYSLNKS